MARRKSGKDKLGAISLDKPDFGQVLSFAEELAQPAGSPDIMQLEGEIAALAAEAPVSVGAPPAQSAAALMPQDEAARKVLEKRAQAIAIQAGERQDELHDQYLRFRLGAVERYGITYQYLEELLYVGNLTRVPCTPAFVSGVINHRGELLTVLDLKQFFRMPPVERGDDARIIVVRHGDMRAGLLVDEVDGNEEYLNDGLSSPMSSEGVSNMEYVQGIHAGSVTLLDIAAIMDDPALQVTR